MNELKILNREINKSPSTNKKMLEKQKIKITILKGLFSQELKALKEEPLDLIKTLNKLFNKIWVISTIFGHKSLELLTTKNWIFTTLKKYLEENVYLYTEKDRKIALNKLASIETEILKDTDQKSPSLITSTLNSISCILRKEKRLETAVYYLQKALKIEKQFGLNSGITTLNLSSINNSLRMYKKALEYSTTSILELGFLYQDSPSEVIVRSLTLAYINNSRNLIALKFFKKAQVMLKKAVNLLNKENFDQSDRLFQTVLANLKLAEEKIMDDRKGRKPRNFLRKKINLMKYYESNKNENLGKSVHFARSYSRDRNNTTFSTKMGMSDLNSHGSRRRKKQRVQSSKPSSKSSSIKNVRSQEEERNRNRPMSSYLFSKNNRNLCMVSPKTEKGKSTKRRFRPRKKNMFKDGIVYFEREIKNSKERGHDQNILTHDVHYRTFQYKSRSKTQSIDRKKFLSRSDFPKFAKRSKGKNFMSDKGIEEVLDISLQQLGESWHENSQSYNNKENNPDVKSRVNFLHELNQFKEKKMPKKSEKSSVGKMLDDEKPKEESSDEVLHVPILKQESIGLKEAMIEVEKRKKEKSKKREKRRKWILNRRNRLFKERLIEDRKKKKIVIETVGIGLLKFHSQKESERVKESERRMAIEEIDSDYDSKSQENQSKKFFPILKKIKEKDRRSKEKLRPKFMDPREIKIEKEEKKIEKMKKKLSKLKDVKRKREEAERRRFELEEKKRRIKEEVWKRKQLEEQKKREMELQEERIREQRKREREERLRQEKEEKKRLKEERRRIEREARTLKFEKKGKRDRIRNRGGVGMLLHMKKRNKKNQDKIKRTSYSSYTEEVTFDSCDISLDSGKGRNFGKYDQEHLKKIRFLQLFFKFRTNLRRNRVFKTENVFVENGDIFTIKICHVDANDDLMKIEIMNFKVSEGDIEKKGYQIRKLNEDETWLFTGREDKLLKDGKLFDSLIIIRGEAEEEKQVEDERKDVGGLDIGSEFKSNELYSEHFEGSVD